MHVCARVWVCVCMCACVGEWVCMRGYMHGCGCAHVYGYVCMCVCVGVGACMCACVQGGVRAREWVCVGGLYAWVWVRVCV